MKRQRQQLPHLGRYPGPPKDETPSAPDNAGQIGETPAARTPDPKQVDLEELIEAENRYEEAIRRRQAEIISEKLQDATVRFAKSIA